jgi:hypothetical protein
MEIVAASLRDIAVMKGDTLYVRHAPDVVHLYDVFLDGRVEQRTPEAMPDVFVTASIEKFNASFRVVPPVQVQHLEDLPAYVGRFEPVSDVHCRLVSP